MTELMFANNFWGLKDEGFHILTSKMNNNKRTFDEIKSFYNIRASLHEEFGRKLMKFSKTGMGREETGTLYALLSSAHKEMEWTAQAHLNLAHKLKTRLEVDLDNFILEQKDKRKLAHANIEKVHRYKVSSEAYLAKVKEKYESDCAKLYTLQAQLPNTAGREADRMKQKMDRQQQEIKVQEQEYRNACIKLADATDQWNKAWKMTCDTYQGMEKKRLEFLHHSFSMYINVLSTASNQDLESYERFWKTLDNYDTEQDIQTFIKEKGTGPKIPEAEVFVDYLDDPSKNIENYTLANFNQPSDLNESLKPKSVSSFDPEPTKSVLPLDPVLPELTVRNPTVQKPLPSRSTPSIRSSTTSSTTTSSTTTNTTARSSNHKPPKKVDEDIKIDPRAKVVFSIGNNMFDLGNLSQEPKPFGRRSTVRQRPDLDPPMNFSYQSLLEELGIFEPKQPLFWARATQANYSTNPNELQYAKGTRLAIIEKSKKEGWYLATKYNEITRSLTQEKGLVSYRCIQQE